MAKERGETIAQLQIRRDNLERDRLQIMEDLEKVRNGDLQGMRRNEAARWIANDIMQNKKGISKLDPVMKDKLVADEVRIK